ncbi:MAG: hypothetical protein ACYCZY_07385 [Lacisediminihabitans sp.]
MASSEGDALGTLFAFLARAPDVVDFTNNYQDREVTVRVPSTDDPGALIIPATIVTTSRHRVWVITLGEEPPETGAIIRQALLEWCQASTLRDGSGRTFRPLHLVDGAAMALQDAQSFEEFASPASSG